jgi:putative ABC transport system substrate-binding protein
MRRRAFMAGTVAVLAVPFAAEAQRANRPPRIGYLGASSPTAASRWHDAFRHGLRDHGYIEGQNITIEWRSAEGRAERIPELAAELVRLNLDVIVTSGDDVTGVLMRSTKMIPIVMATSGDPVASGYVASLARPGGNITGLSGQLRELPVKRIQLLKEMLPTAQRLGHLTRHDQTIAESVLAEREIEDATQALGLVRTTVRVRDAQDIDSAFALMARKGMNAVMVATQSFMFLNRQRIADVALAHKLPAFGGFRELPAAGGLMSYGVDSADLWRRAARYVHRIVKGAKPADLPVEQPTKFELLINLKTAKALGLTVPPTLLVRADHVIE